MKVKVLSTFDLSGYPEFEEGTQREVPEGLGNELIERGLVEVFAQEQSLPQKIKQDNSKVEEPSK